MKFEEEKRIDLFRKEKFYYQGLLTNCQFINLKQFFFLPFLFFSFSSLSPSMPIEIALAKCRRWFLQCQSQSGSTIRGIKLLEAVRHTLLAKSFWPHRSARS